jgi:hypothetical protein
MGPKYLLRSFGLLMLVNVIGLKVAFFQKVRFVFQISKSPEKNIPKNYPELENSRPFHNIVMGGNFKFHVQGRFGDLKNESHFLKKSHL